MTDEVTGSMITHIFATYGPAALPIIGLLLLVKYLLDKDKQRETTHKVELEAERQRTREERTRGDGLQAELLKEARGNADLAEQVQQAMLALARGTH